MRTLARLCGAMLVAALLIFPSAPRTSARPDSVKASGPSAPPGSEVTAALQAAVQQARLQASDADDEDEFGVSVAVSADGNTALVGAPNNDHGTDPVAVDSFHNNAGVAYVFTRSGTRWSQQTRLIASDPSDFHEFGSSVAVSADGNTALVAARGADSVYAFTRSGTVWTQQQRFQAAEGSPSDFVFGISVAVSADGVTALVGAAVRDFGPGGTIFDGAAYVFTRSGNVWTQQQRLKATQPSSLFGDSVALSSDGNTALVGSSGDHQNNVSVGSVYVFTRSGTVWSVQARLMHPSPGQFSEEFGDSVAVSADGNTALVGASGHDPEGRTNAGAGFVFVRNGAAWTLQARLAGRAEFHLLGVSAALSADGNTALLGARGAGPALANSGAAYVFARNAGGSWAEHDFIQVPSTTAPNTFGDLDNFGFSVALNSNGRTALVGAPTSDNSGGIDAGLAYTFIVPPATPNRIDSSDFFVRQHYLDFLNREPDAEGLAFWTNVIESCGADAQCREVRRINVSAAFFLSIEFRETGYLVEKVYKAAYGDATGTSTLGGTHQLLVPIVRFEEFVPDAQRVGRDVVVNQGDWQGQLEANKVAFTQEFVQRQRFLNDYPLSLTPAQFVDRLNGRAAGPLDASERQALIDELTANNTTAGRASVLRKVAEDPTLDASERNRAFVLMQYFGYLRRDPNEEPDTDYTGYDFWLGNLNKFNGNFEQAELVKAFISSTEYRQRFWD